MKIKSKKLILAVCLLLVSAVMVGTASFAWFSMNTEVDVDGIEVEAYSDSLFLEISTAKGGAYNTSVTLEGDKQYIRLAKHGFVTAAYTLTATPASGNYASGTYYKKVELTDSNYKYVIADDLAAGASDVIGLYKNPVFTKITNDSATMENGGVYYEKVGSKYAPVTTVAGANAVGLYVLEPVYTLVGGEDTKAADGVTYYSLAGGVYTAVENVVAGDTVVSTYYTASAIAAETTGATYDSTATYYTKTTANEFYAVNPVTAGTSLEGYFTVTNVQAVADLTRATGEVFVQTATGEYSLLGDFGATETNIANMLYFGRAYSDTLTSADASAALNIIKDDTNNYLDNYRYAESIFLQNAVNTNDSRNLQAEFTVTGENALDEAVRIVLVVYDVTGTKNDFVNYVEYSNAGATSTTYGNGQSNIINLLAGNTQQTLRVDIYVYYDGSDASASNATDGVLELSGNKVEIKFTIDGPDYN